VLRSVQEALDAAAVERGGEVEDRAADRRDGDRFVRRRQAVQAASAVQPDACAPRPPTASGDRDVNGARRARAQTPQGAGCSVTENGGRSARQDGRHPRPAPNHDGVPDRIDTVMHPMQPARGAAVGDRPVAEAEPAQLPARDDPVLPRSQCRNRPVDHARCGFFRDSNHFPHQAAGAPVSPPSMRPYAPRSSATVSVKPP